MNWTQLLSLKRFGDTETRLRKDQNETRLGFDVDYDRIIFSDAFRSMQDKTQVIPLSKTDFVHTRLTHSMEVSVVARSLGRIVGEQLIEKHKELAEQGYTFNDFGAIVASAALAHDIGNPPFGHSGEKAIGEYFKNGSGTKYNSSLSGKEWQDLVDFEGNANGFRILNQSKPGIEGGLRLSYATLGAFTKYPKESLPKKPTQQIANKKYGFFQTEREFFKDVADDLGLIENGSEENIAYKRHPLAYLVEAADDICYTIIDFEDGINLGLIEEEFALEYLVKLVKDDIINQKYYDLPFKSDRISYLRAVAIGSLIKEAADIFIKNEEAILKGEFHYSLLEKCKYEAQINDIIKISVEKIYKSRGVVEKELLGYKVISFLLHTFIEATNNTFENTASNYDKLVIQLLPESLRKPKTTLYERIQAICGFVASLTDGYAIQLYHKLNG